jgi:hypothetical protein
MNANELRIGNWYEFTGKDVPEHIIDGRIFQWAQDCFYYDSEGGSLMENTIGITLTEEWLLKFGFEKEYHSGSLYYYKVNHVYLRYRESDNRFFFKYDSNGNSLINIKFIHELQTLYYALTGEELKLKE